MGSRPLNKHSGYTQILPDLSNTDPLLLEMAGLFKYKTNFLKTKSFAYKGDALWYPLALLETVPLHASGIRVPGKNSGSTETNPW